MKNFRRSTTKIFWMNTAIFSFDSICIKFALCQISWGRWLCNHFKYFENQKSAMLMSFCIVNAPRCQILIWGTKYFACFSRFLPVKKMDCIEKSNPSPSSTLVLTPLFYQGVVRLKCLFCKTRSSYKKLKSFIRDEKCWILWKARLREMIILLQKHKYGKCRKKCKRSKKKESNLFLFQVINLDDWFTLSYLLRKTIELELFRMFKEWYIWTNDHHHYE